MIKQFIIFFLFFSVACFGQNDKKGTIKVKKVEVDTAIYPTPDKLPEFPGGNQAMGSFVSTNLTYPDSARQYGLSGTCYITFVVEVDGTKSNFKVVKGVKDCPICDQDAINVIKKMPKFMPGMKDGVPVRVTYNIPVNFRLK